MACWITLKLKWRRLVVDVYVGLGSNVGDRLRFLSTAVVKLSRLPSTVITAVSSIYATDPVGVEDQDEFLNGAVKLSTELSLTDFHAGIKRIEREIGRLDRKRWGPREIDIDILLFGMEERGHTGIAVPHPEMTQRNFVLMPLAEIGGAVIHPERHLTIEALKNQCTDQHAVRKQEALTSQLLTLIKEISCSSITQTSAM
jgi:2-amino-4-hydroxy-6-hydroxymethyldihydropteridine diphosphokinase